MNERMNERRKEWTHGDGAVNDVGLPLDGWMDGWMDGLLDE